MHRRQFCEEIESDILFHPEFTITSPRYLLGVNSC